MDLKYNIHHYQDIMLIKLYILIDVALLNIKCKSFKMLSMAQPYVMTPDSLYCPGKDNRPQNQHREGIVEG